MCGLGADFGTEGISVLYGRGIGSEGTEIIVLVFISVPMETKIISYQVE